MADYTFYTDTYLGSSIPVEEFARIAARAQAQLARYERIYTISGTDEQKQLAVCAMTDALYYYEQAANGAVAENISVGSVSSSVRLPDTSPTAQATELLRCVKLYLRVYRGCG